MRGASIHSSDSRASSDTELTEEARIRRAYGKRRHDDPRYSWFNPAHLSMVQERERELLRTLSRYKLAPLTSKTILEIGCGTGYWLREFIKWGAAPENISGIELLENRFHEARGLCPPGVNLYCASARQLAFPDSTFDLVLQSTMFTSILDASLKRQIASEMMRVLNKRGAIIWYDYRVNNPWNPDVRGIKKREIVALFPGCNIRLKRITLAPPLARLMAPYSRAANSLFEQIPLLCTHYLGVIQKS